MKAAFKITRASGKSNQQVVIEFVSGAEPGTLFTFDQIAAVLSEGTERTYDRSEVGQIVRVANTRLLREHKRYLRSRPGEGYSIALAKDHRELAGGRNRKSQRQLKWALDTLENVRLDEMNEGERSAHIAQLEVNAILFDQQKRILRRQTEQSRLILNLASRVEQIEAGQSKGK
jgi:hypothetical protein